MKYLRGMEERRLAEKDKVDELIEQKCKEHVDKLRRELGLGQNNGQNNGKMFRAALLVGILVLFYFIGYSGTRSTKLMLKWQLWKMFNCMFSFWMLCMYKIIILDASLF
jgi:hypothetical protein